MDAADLDAIRTVLRDELASIGDQLATIEEKLGLIPDLNFLHSSQLAQQVMVALRKAEAKPLEPHVGLTVPPGDPGRLRRPT
jgi:hypothetical protein